MGEKARREGGEKIMEGREKRDEKGRKNEEGHLKSNAMANEMIRTIPIMASDLDKNVTRFKSLAFALNTFTVPVSSLTATCRQPNLYLKISKYR